VDDKVWEKGVKQIVIKSIVLLICIPSHCKICESSQKIILPLLKKIAGWLPKTFAY